MTENAKENRALARRIFIPIYNKCENGANNHWEEKEAHRLIRILSDKAKQLLISYTMSKKKKV